MTRENHDTDTGPHGWTRDYLFAEGRTLAAIGAADGTRYYHPDHLGHTRAMSNGSGNLAALNHFYPFGEAAYAWNPYGQPLRFTGHERDDNLSGTLDDLDYMHARFYSPHLGRFMRVDPAAQSFNPQNPQSWNRYSYVLNRPMKYIDPTGEVLDTIADIGFVAYDLWDIGSSLVEGEGVSGVQWGALGADVLGAVVPFATGGGLVVRGAARVDDAIDAGRALDNSLPRLPRSVGAAANEIQLTSRIKDSSFAVRQAENLSQAVQRDVDNLLGALKSGNANPGIGTRSLGNGFHELRGANGGRVIVKQTSAGGFDIVGKFQAHARGKKANADIIFRLINDYLK